MNDIYVGALFSDSYLEHHGILGMKWGVRRFQREDGSLTSAGKKRKSLGQKISETRNTARKNRVTNKVQKDIDYWRRDIEASKQYKKNLKTGRHGDFTKKELKEEYRLMDSDIKRAQNHIKTSTNLQKKIDSVDISKYSAKEYKREIDKIIKGTFASKR